MTDVAEISSRTALEIAFAYRNGETTPAAVTEYLLDRVAATRSSNIFISVLPDRARAEAAAATERYQRGRPLSVLDGVPVAWKDLIDVAGAPTTGGSTLFSATEKKAADAPCVANAAAGGMVSVGKLNLTELAYSGLGLNPHFGTPVNPNDPKVHRSPGGSSSGSGAAVAAGLVPCAIGTDTGGSVRIPASFNGVVGYKTSERRIDKSKVIPLSRTLDTVGPLARSVADCIALDMLLRGAPTSDIVSRDLRGVKLVVPTNMVFDDAEPAVLANFDAALEAFARAGAVVTRKALPAFEKIAEMTSRHGSLTAAEAYLEYHAVVDGDRVGKVDRRVVHRIVRGREMSAFDLLNIRETRRATIAEMNAELADALLVMPTTPITAPEIAPLDADDKLFHEVNLRALRNTMLGNNLRQCGLAIPSGRDSRGLPTSILISAPHGADARLLSAGLEIERALAGHFQPLSAAA